jgi:dolichyl-diphosphooligosaccharide--protein glycosyltransferase
MEANEGRPSSRPQKERKSDKGSLQTRFKNSWLGQNWGTVIVLVAIVLIALFVRSYFGFSTAVDNDYLLAGGSDSYYHLRVIEHVENTGTHLVNDPLLNYPMGIRNMRPPVYDWSVAVTSMVMSGISGASIHDSTGYTLLFSTAFWGALTCIPVFLLTRAAFGNRAGLLASFLFAIMAGNVSRTIFADADHDAFVLFFVVFALYFLLRALMTINGTKWVSDWRKRDTIVPGLRNYFATNRVSMIYALLGGICISLVANTWTGYTYIVIIILVYFLVQVIINRFRNVDSMGEWFVIGIMLASAFALMAPLYWQMNYWATWFDVPFYLFAASLVVGGIFTVTRDYPWTLVIPIVVGLLVIGLVGIFFLAPNLFDAIVSGQGYLVKSKLYSTIQEAQAPTFSNLALSFGAMTFWLALVGVVWAAIKIPKNTSPYLVFIVVWLGLSIYMAASAGRFMFNASPAFAMAAGWILALILARVKFEEVPKLFSGFLSHPWQTIKKGTKVRHVAVVLFLAFLIVLPNVWGAIDAGIPSETKRTYDKQIYNALPDFLHPSGYDKINGSYWYLGAFSYSLPLPSTYYPSAWNWFAQQDQNKSIEDRPAYLSWWDYGFEAVQSGKHPTVADNFQDGYQYAGSFLMSENESDAVALFIVRLLEKTGFNDTTTSILESHGVDVAALKEYMYNPGGHIQQILDNSSVYGNFTSDISAANAKYSLTRIELEKVGLNNLVAIYHDLRESSGYDIGYVAVDSRLFPFTATSSNIFYAPAKLSDREIDSATGSPTNYYQIKAILSDYTVVDIKDLISTDQVIGYQIYYTPTFYKTMLYRTFMGLSPSDIGTTSTYALPGISGALQSYDAMPGFNLTHFRQVYRTAYVNDYNSTQVANHSDAWRAVSFEEAQYFQDLKDAGKWDGTIDMSSSSLQSGVVFIQYYDGAIMKGTAKSTDGTPYAGIYVTVTDELGIPHQTVKTASDGTYEVYLPFGNNISVVYSAGTLGKGTNIATEIARKSYNISYGQAQRLESFSADGNITLPGSTVTGRVFWDINGNGIYDVTEEKMAGATVTLVNNQTGFKATTTTDSNGVYTIVGLAGDSNYLTASYDGHTFGGQTFTMTANSKVTKNVALKPASITGTLSFSNGDAAVGAGLSLTDQSNGKVTNVTTKSGGAFTFSKLMPGLYKLTSINADLSLGTQTYNLTAGKTEKPSLSLYSASQISGTVKVNGASQGNVAIGFITQSKEVVVIADSSGHYNVTLPQGTYTVYAKSIKDNVDYVTMFQFVADSNTMSLDLNLDAGAVVSGTVTTDGTSVAKNARVTYTSTSTGTFLNGTTDSNGAYRLVLPNGEYFVYSASSSKAYWGIMTVSGSVTNNITLQDSAVLSGKVFYDANGNNNLDNGEALSNAVLTVKSNTTSAQSVSFLSGSGGTYSIVLPKGSGYVLSVTKDGYTTWTKSYEPLNASESTNIALGATNRTVTGTVNLGGSPVDGIVVNFQQQGSSTIAASATTDSTGKFTVSLKPGTYYVSIDQDAVAGDNSVKYQYNASLTVPIGRDPTALDISLVERVKVTGTVVTGAGPAQNTVRFIGADNKTLNVSTAFILYLQSGTYSIYVNGVGSGKHYANLTTADVGVGTNLTINVDPASTVSGQLQLKADSTDLRIPASITISKGSASYTTTATSQGAFTTYLPNGTYTVGADYHTKATINGTSRYVVYTASQSVTVNGETTNVQIKMDRSLDNSTLSGSISGATSGVEWKFTALDSTGIDATVTSGSGDYSIDLAPGTYSMYGIDGANHVYMGTVAITARAQQTNNVTMSTGIAVSGIAKYKGSPVSGAEVILSNNALVKVTTDNTGYYYAVLPAGLYNASATWVHEEVSGVNVTYSQAFDVNLTATATKNFDLIRQIKGAVGVSWSDAKKTIDAGQTVVYNVTVTNRGNIDDTYKLTATADPGWTVSFSQTSVSLGWGPDSSKTVQVTIKTPSNAKVSHSAVKITATSTNNTAATSSANVDVTVRPSYGVGVSLGSPESATNMIYTYPVQVKNTGNIQDSFNLTLSSEVINALKDKGWNLTISGTTNNYSVFTVGAGSTKTVNLLLTRIANTTTDANVSVDVAVINSGKNQTATANIPLEKGAFGTSGSGLTVSGDNISMSPQQIPSSTWFLLVLIVLMLVVIVILRVNKGVFGRRRKR